VNDLLEKFIAWLEWLYQEGAYGVTKYNNQWIRLDSGFNLPLNMFISLFYEYDFGDDLEGQRIFAELGYRF